MSKLFNIRMDERLIKKLKEQSQRECRSISEIIRQISIEYLEKKNA